MRAKSEFKSKSKVIGIIPARYSSSRFPGKILASIAGESLIQRTYFNAKRCSLLETIVIATDDRRIYDHVTSFGGRAVMTSVTCPTGTDRLVEAFRNHAELHDAEIIVNIQGDEPCLDPYVIERIVGLLEADPQAVMSTAAVPLTCEEEACSSAIVKCVIDCHNNALYFSRALIPSGHNLKWQHGHPYYRHMGIYAYKRDFLLQYGEIPQTPLQRAEDLEQLKVLESGFKIKVAVVDHFSIGVDLPEDIQKVEKWLCNNKQSTSLSQVESARRSARA